MWEPGEKVLVPHPNGIDTQKATVTEDNKVAYGWQEVGNVNTITVRIDHGERDGFDNVETRVVPAAYVIGVNEKEAAVQAKRNPNDGRFSK